MTKLASLVLAVAACGRMDMDPVDPLPDASEISQGTTQATARTIGPSLTIDSGPILGYADNDLVVFKGIPYVAPPLGARRFAPPAPVTPWVWPRWTIFDPPACPQPTPTGTTGNEDCLTVNVWTHPDAANRPVLFFVHGGSGITGQHYDSAALARHTGTAR